MPSDVKQHSVTADDIIEYRDGIPGIVNFLLPYGGQFGLNLPLPPYPPPYWTKKRDTVLRSTIYNESMWASANHIAITKMSSAAWEVASSVPLRARFMQDLMQNIEDGSGWVAFLSKHLRDFLNTDNGAFVEIVRATDSWGSKIIGLMHLDSLRIMRTGDPDIPIVYTDLKGRIHELKSYQVMCFSDMMEPGENFFGIGLCAASRAYRAIYKLASIETYVSEKVSGSRALAIHLVRGISPKQIKEAVETADQEHSSKGVYLYKGAIVVPFLGGDVSPQVITIPLAEMPDGFDANQERQHSHLVYADAIGLDPQDLQPLSSGPLGTGTQSLVLADKEKGKGLVAWRQQFTHMMNLHVAPDATRFMFIEKDYKDQAEKAGVDKQKSDIAAGQIQVGLISVDQGRQILVDEDVLPKWTIAKDDTTDVRLNDTEKPISDEEIKIAQETNAKLPAPKPQEQQPQPPQVPSEKMKEIGDGAVLLKLSDLVSYLEG